MSSWLFSLRGSAGSGCWRVLERYGFGAPRVPDDLFDTTPGRPGTETAAQISQKGCDLLIGHAVGKTRHDGAVFPADRANAAENEVGGVARIRRDEGRAETKVDSAVGQRTIGFVAGCTGRLIDRGAGVVGCCGFVREIG